jgi:rhodanese-related sulfurtransferase
VEQYIEFVGNHYLLCSAWVGLLLVIVFSYIKQLTSPVKVLSPQLVTQKINRSDGVVVDIRNKAEYEKGHIAGAVHLLLEKIQKNELSSLEKSKTKPIIVVCNAGMSASGAAATLLKNGFADVCILQGGMNTWRSANLPVSKK